MHIQIQCCGIVLMLVLFYFYMRQRRIALHTQRTFLNVFWSTFACIAVDILSIGTIELGVALSALSYMCSDIYRNQ